MIQTANRTRRTTSLPNDTSWLLFFFPDAVFPPSVFLFVVFFGFDAI